MSGMQQLSEFLKARRARLHPEDVGAVDFGSQRRVPGLRREELALLAGMSVDYYTRLEQGRARRVSSEILDAVARALQLDDDERAHLHNLARPTTTRKRPARAQQVGAEMRQALHALDTVPAYIIGRRLDVLAWNEPARVLIADFPSLPATERNMARLVFLDEGAKHLYPDWESKARDTVSNLRVDAGRHPNDPQLAGLVGELSMGNADFRRLWADHSVRGRTRGRKRFVHPLVGELALDYVAMRAPDDPDMTMMIYSAPAGSGAETSLLLLAGLGQQSLSPGSSQSTARHENQATTPSASTFRPRRSTWPNVSTPACGSRSDP